MSNVLLNFRDISENCDVKSGVIYRGRALISDDMSEEDKAFVDSLKIRHIIDLRGNIEIENSGAYYVPEGTVYHHKSAIKSDIHRDDNLNTDIEYARHMIEKYLVDAYRNLPFDNEAYRFMIECIIKKETPIYINCSAGKDRTGVGAMIGELLLGVSEEEIYDDYLKSYDNYYSYYKDKGFDDMPRPSLCFREWLEASLLMIKDKYYSYDTYLMHEYQLSEEDLKTVREYYR